MVEIDVINRLIRDQQLDNSDLAHILTLSSNEIIQNLIGLKGGFVYRAYLLERLMELIDGPRGVAVPETIYKEALGIGNNRPK